MISTGFSRFLANRIAGAVILLSASSACGGDDPTPPASTVAGNYVATVFTVTPNGQAPIDVLASGGSLTISISSANVSSGQLNLPASVTGGAPIVASMAGTATVTGATVQFTQSADTFVRNLTWNRSSSGLTVTAQSAGAASFTITLTKS